MKRQNKGGQQCEEKKLKLNPQGGCKFCRAKDNVWNNHGVDACVPNPKSPSYRPRNGRNHEQNSSTKRSGPRSTGQQQTAAMNTETTVTKKPDFTSYWQTKHEEHGAAMTVESGQNSQSYHLCCRGSRTSDSVFRVVKWWTSFCILSYWGPTSYSSKM
ncbi:hypothetical protein PHMEG_00035043 [Phytophthora megakarya]|uniref:Uncharacterized protein n=1 Tax=Phytophthora megakarya TaxID=4795 RepID=A0A225UPP6_9STRA|nr:hypothetical protein PHMEG_00035043 [Phytophthora megakarya]